MPSELLKNLMKKAEDCDLVLPEFQRDFVWKPSDVIKLLTSVMNGYPIGGLLFMESNSDNYGARPLDGVKKESPKGKDVLLILDGQQRLTSCYRAFYNSMDVDKYPGRYYINYKEFIKNPEISGSELENIIIFVRKKDVEKKYQSTANELSEGYFPLDIILKPSRSIDYSKWLSDYTFYYSERDKRKYEEFSHKQSIFIRNLIEKVTSYHVHYEEIKKNTSSDVICTVFETINTTGKKLTVFDLLVARCFSADIKLRDMLSSALEKPMIKKFDPEGEELCVNALPRIIAMRTKQAIRRGDLLDLNPKTIKENWDYSVNALEKTLDFLNKHFGCIGLKYLPFTDLIVPMAIIITNEKFKETSDQMEKLKKWYWRSVFSQYMVSSIESKVARTVKEFISEGGWLDDDSKEPESVKDFNLKTSILDDVYRIDSAVYRGVMCMLISKGIVDIGRERKRLIDCLADEIDDHHIYPSKFLKSCGIKNHEIINNIANRTPILKNTNLKISDQSPSVYLNDPDIVGEGGIPDNVLIGHCIDPNLVKASYRENLFNEFIIKRKEILIKEISKLVGAEATDYED